MDTTETDHSTFNRPQAPEKFRIAICGAGIAGLALAAFLGRSDNIAVDIYESKDEIRTTGAGIALWRRFWNTLNRELDFDRACVELKATAPGGWDTAQSALIRKADSPPMTDGGLFAVIHHAFKSYARQGLLGALLSKINPDTCKVYTGHRLRHYTVTPESKIKLHFGYDTPTTCDILIGADGIHSRVRYMMYDSTPEHAKPVFGGQCAYRMVVSADGLRKKDANNACLTGFNMWSGKGRHFVTTAIGPKIYVTAYENVPSHEPIERTKDWVKSASPKKILSLAEGWEPDLVNLLKESAIPDDQGNRATRWAVHVIPPIPTFSSGPIAVIGDAAHAMLPHQGLGACTGIEDAFVLAKLLQSPLATKVTLTKVLQAFDSVRRPQAQAAVRGSEVSGKIFDLEHESQIGKSLEEIGHEIAQVGEWLTVDSGCEDSAEEAVEVLSELCRTTPYALPPAISHLDSVNGKGIDEVTTVSLRDVESYRKPES